MQHVVGCNQRVTVLLCRHQLDEDIECAWVFELNNAYIIRITFINIIVRVNYRLEEQRAEDIVS
jgi:hypothetical protein